MGAISALFVLDLKGRIIIYRDYRGEIPAKQAEKFISELNAREEAGRIQPIFLAEDGVSYVWTQHSNLYFLAVANSNANVTSVMTFLRHLIDIFQFYFQELEEESLRDNFVICYELLDEVMDFGYPQFTEARILSEFIKTNAHKLQVDAPVEAPKEVTGATSWRTEGIVYKKNEVFLDVCEKVNLLVNTNGTVVRSEVLGSLDMRCYLSGMPDCRLGLNDKVAFELNKRSTNKTVELEDIKFHQCVRLGRFANDRNITFCPPDGAFQLMTYRLNQSVTPLIWVECLVEQHGRSRTEYVVKARSQFKERLSANNVRISIPLPKDATSPLMRASCGSAEYLPEQDRLMWTIKSFQGRKEFLLRCKFSLPSVAAEDEVQGRRPPINVQFEIPYYTVSGIQVRYLKVVERSGYNALPWVRYITKAGDYEIRMM